MEIVEKANAKINLTLDITGKEGGYHTLDMIVASIDLHDLVTVRTREDNEILAYMDGDLCLPNNSALIAARLMQERFLTCGFDIYIEKHIPFSGGLGGSTADGVAVVRAIQKLCNISDDEITTSFLISIGSDAPCMYKDGVKRVRGIGDKIEFIDIKIPYKVAIIAGDGVNTAQAYKAYDSITQGKHEFTKVFISDINNKDFDVAKHLGNALFIPAIKLNQTVEKSYIEMLNMGATGVCMSGSGSAVYGLFSGDVPKELESYNFVY